jgi:hypothetical protein
MVHGNFFAARLGPSLVLGAWSLVIRDLRPFITSPSPILPILFILSKNLPVRVLPQKHLNVHAGIGINTRQPF